MSFIGLVPEAADGTELAPLYAQIRAHYGFLPNYFQAQGRDPGLIAAQLAMGSALLKDGALSAVVKEQIGIVVSGINSSSYCIAAHLELLRKFGIEKPLGRKLATDYAAAPVGERLQALFRFADKLTRNPFDVVAEDIEALREAGWSEDAIREAAVSVAWFNCVNRISSGLGLVADF
jgi:uncharacterized peroxidase-related enzyme